MITIFNKINELPYEIINLIKEYIPNKNIVFVNKKFYLSYHNLIKISIINFENYIRDMIRRDNEFIFNNCTFNQSYQIIIRNNCKLVFNSCIFEAVSDADSDTSGSAKVFSVISISSGIINLFIKIKKLKN